MFDAALSIRAHLASLGLGAIGGSNPFDLHVGHMPNTPNAVVLINVTGGQDPLPTLLLNFPSIQVMVRGAASGYVDASARIAQITNALLGITTVVLNGDTYRGCNQIGDISYLGQDDNTRPLFSANFWFNVEPAPMAGGHRISIT